MAGRPKGSRNKKTIAREERIAREGVTPLEYLLTIVRDEEQEQAQRVDAAKAAAPYVHPRLATVEQNVTGEMNQTHSADRQSVEQAVEALYVKLDTFRKGHSEETP